MTPQQKLVYLKSLDVRRAELRNLALFPASHRELEDLKEGLNEIEAECVRVLADVHLPPPELMNVPDAETWAHHMARTLPGLSQETAYAWLDKAMMVAHAKGWSEGHVSGAKQTSAAAQDGRQALVDAVRLVLGLQRRGALRPPMVRDPNDPDNPPVPLYEHLENMLRSLGEEP